MSINYRARPHNGNRQTKTDPGGTTTYTYDYENRLIRIDMPGGAWASYDYDAFGRRVRKNDNGTITLDWYNGEDIVAETNASGSEQARYTHGPGIDSPLKVKRGSSKYYYHEDALDSIVLMTDEMNEARKTYKYDAFGNILTQTGTVTNTYTYTGRELDAESGLYYYRARTYDPVAGRFLQVDPIPQRPEEMNAYVYVANNPINWVDPFGLMKDCEDPFGDCYERCLNTLLVKPVTYLKFTLGLGVSYLAGSAPIMGVPALQLGGAASGAAIGAYAIGTESAASSGAIIGGSLGEGALSGLGYGAAALAGWGVGVGIGCAISCGLDNSNY